MSRLMSGISLRDGLASACADMLPLAIVNEYEMHVSLDLNYLVKWKAVKYCKRWPALRNILHQTNYRQKHMRSQG